MSTINILSQLAAAWKTILPRCCAILLDTDINSERQNTLPCRASEIIQPAGNIQLPKAVVSVETLKKEPAQECKRKSSKTRHIPGIKKAAYMYKEGRIQSQERPGKGEGQGPCHSSLGNFETLSKQEVTKLNGSYCWQEHQKRETDGQWKYRGHSLFLKAV